jgi:golgi phosphoprotein 3
MLSLAEEVLLLALDDKTGTLREGLPGTLGRTLVAAVLMELAFLARIDTDQRALFVVDSTPVGDTVLDDALVHLAKQPKQRSSYAELKHLLGQAQEIQQRLLDRLVSRGIVKVVNERILWVFGVRRYPLLDDRKVKEVKARLREVVLGDDLPDPRDAVLISLVEAAHLWGDAFTTDELAHAHARIERLARLDFIGQALARAIHEIEATLAFAHPI